MKYAETGKRTGLHSRIDNYWDERARTFTGHFVI